jgi:hypothetical protein
MVFLITQYFVHGFLDKKYYANFDTDLNNLKTGVYTAGFDFTRKIAVLKDDKTTDDMRYVLIIKEGDKEVPVIEYPLPRGYEDRIEWFKIAKGIFS